MRLRARRANMPALQRRQSWMFFRRRNVGTLQELLVVVSTFVDEGISGAEGRRDRAGYNALLEAITSRDIDSVAAWSVDRLSRSLPDLLNFLGELHSKNCDLYPARPRYEHNRWARDVSDDRRVRRV